MKYRPPSGRRAASPARPLRGSRPNTSVRVNSVTHRHLGDNCITKTGSHKLMWLFTFILFVELVSKQSKIKINSTISIHLTQKLQKNFLHRFVYNVAIWPTFVLNQCNNNKQPYLFIVVNHVVIIAIIHIAVIGSRCFALITVYVKN